MSCLPGSKHRKVPRDALQSLLILLLCVGYQPVWRNAHITVFIPVRSLLMCHCTSEIFSSDYYCHSQLTPYCSPSPCLPFPPCHTYISSPTCLCPLFHWNINSIQQGACVCLVSALPPVSRKEAGKSIYFKTIC